MQFNFATLQVLREIINTIDSTALFIKLQSISNSTAKRSAVYGGYKSYPRLRLLYAQAYQLPMYDILATFRQWIR